MGNTINPAVPDPNSPEFDRFFTETKSEIESMLMRRYRCQLRDAEDTAMEALEEFTEDPGGFDPRRGSVVGWVYGIARNIWRARRRTEFRFEFVPLDEDRLVDERTPDPAEEYEAWMLREDIWDTVHRLPPRQDWAMTGRYERNQSIKELMIAGGYNRNQVNFMLRQGAARVERRLRAKRAGSRRTLGAAGLSAGCAA